MTVLLILAGVAFTTFMLYMMVKPLVVSREDAVRVDHLADQFREIELLMARRAVLLSSLRELEFERETDKIAQEDYERFRVRFEREAVTIMKRLDDLHGGRGWETRIDEELEERLGRQPHIVKMKAAAAEANGDDTSSVEESSEAKAEQEEPEVQETPATEEHEEPAAPEEQEEEAEHEEPSADDDAPAGDDAPAASSDEDEEEPADEKPQSIERDAEESLACTECGSELAEDDKFCSQCGTPTPFADRAPKEASA